MAKRLIILLFFIGIIIALRFLGLDSYLSFAHIQENRLYLAGIVEQQYFVSVAAYVAIFVVSAAFGIPITVLLTILAGAIFGIFWGAIYANIGATIGASFSFLIFRYFLGSVVQKRYSNQLTQLNKDIKQHGHNYLLALQLLPFTPTLLINTLAGLTKIRFWTFVWATSLGILPGSLIYTFAGSQIAMINSVSDVFSGGMFIALILLGLLALIPILIRLKKGL